jgi:acyl carrier protein
VEKMTKEDVEKKIRGIVSEKLGVAESEIKRESKFKENFGADSLDIVEMTMEIEDEFKINIPDGELELELDVSDSKRGDMTFGQLVDYVFKKVSSK